MDDAVLKYFKDEYDEYGIEITTPNIVDAGILVGGSYESAYASSGTGALDGLWELYNNVVKVFVDGMMEEGLRYAGISGTPLPTDNWIARTGESSLSSARPHGPGMSYCYGCKDTIEEFNKTVAFCQAGSTDAIKRLETDDITGNEYRGNLRDITCEIGGGDKDWAGLEKNEWKLRKNYPCFNPLYWAGIDCSGFVQRVVNYAEKKGELRNLVTTRIPDISSSLAKAIGSCSFFLSNTICDTLANEMEIWFDIKEYESVRSFNFVDSGKIKRGDLVAYKGHISLIYCTPSDDPTGECVGLKEGEYKIVHASGDKKLYYGKDFQHIEDETDFNRKVIINEIKKNILGALKNPLGFGRIKLWD